MTPPRAFYSLICVMLCSAFVVAGCAPLALQTETALPTLAATQTLSAYPAPTEPLPTEVSSPEPDFGATLEARLTNEPIPTVIRETGICECIDAGLASMGYELRNSWQQQVNGVWSRVQAGALTNDLQQGVIVVAREIPNTISVNFHFTPVKAGAVRITAEQDYRLILQADNGQVFYFDVPGQAFVSSLTEQAPTVTPAPTFTPAPPTPPVPTGYPNPQPTLLLTAAP